MHLQRRRGRGVDGRGHIHSTFARQRSSEGCRLPGEGRFPTLIPKWLVVDWLEFAYNLKWSDSYQFELLLSKSFVENNATQNERKHRVSKGKFRFLEGPKRLCRIPDPERPSPYSTENGDADPSNLTRPLEGFGRSTPTHFLAYRGYHVSAHPSGCVRT